MTMPSCTVGENTTGLLYLTDVFGIQLAENRLLADSFARAGFITVAPDLFEGQPAPMDLNNPAFNTTDFLAMHNTEATDAIMSNAIDFMRTTLGVKKLAVTGYCFGGRYSFRAVGGNGQPAGAALADVAFAAHPSLLEDAEILSIKGPASVAAAETDTSMPPERRAQIEGMLANMTMPFQLSLYGGVSHGFGVRANVSDPQGKFAKESAFLQAVRFFESF